MNEKIKLGIIGIILLIITSFIFLSPLRHKVISMLSIFSHNDTASVGDVFTDSFNSDTSVEEAGSMDESKDASWWVNSGAYLLNTNGEVGTVQGDLSADDPWVSIYKESNAIDTDDGIHPQNIFRLVNKNLWQNFSQEAYFKINGVNLSASDNRNQSNGLLLFNRYVDSDNLYYTGVRVDGDMVIKKKISGEYYTMSSGNIFPGSYDSGSNPNLIPTGEWMGLKSEVVTLPSGHVLINLYTDVGRTGTWTLGLSVQDDGSSFGGSPIVDAGHSGIRTDFLDVSFSNYSITEHDPLDLTPADELPKGSITFNFDGKNSTEENTKAISEGITFRLEGSDALYSNTERVELSEGTYVVIPEYSGATFIFGEDCNDGKISVLNNDDKTCTVLEEIIESDSGDETDGDSIVTDAGGSSGSGSGDDSSLDETLPVDDGTDDTDLGALYLEQERQAEDAKNIKKEDYKKIEEEIKKEDNTQDIVQTIEDIVKKLDTVAKTELTTANGKVFYSLDPEDVINVVESPIVTPSLGYGIRDSAQVKVLQAFLAQDKEIYPESLVTGFFGPLTESAVKRFQIKNGVINVLDPFKFGYGKVGPNTIKKINEVYKNNLKKDEVLFIFSR